MTDLVESSTDMTTERGFFRRGWPATGLFLSLALLAWPTGGASEPEHDRGPVRVAGSGPTANISADPESAFLEIIQAAKALGGAVGQAHRAALDLGQDARRGASTLRVAAPTLEATASLLAGGAPQAAGQGSVAARLDSARSSLAIALKAGRGTTQGNGAVGGGAAARTGNLAAVAGAVAESRSALIFAVESQLKIRQGLKAAAAGLRGRGDASSAAQVERFSARFAARMLPALERTRRWAYGEALGQARLREAVMGAGAPGAGAPESVLAIIVR